MNFNTFYSKNNGFFSFTREKASSFAKAIAGDFNPIHDPESSRFCVPGDLLFTLMLKEIGLYNKMSFKFSGMINEQHQLQLSQVENKISLIDNDKKSYLDLTKEGKIFKNEVIIDRIIDQYVKFSGKNFPEILVPIMQAHNVMISPDKPLVIYESMKIEFSDFSLLDKSLKLELSDSILEVKGKRAIERLVFNFICGNKTIGKGEKIMLLSGLRAFDINKLQKLIDQIVNKRNRYQQRISND